MICLFNIKYIFIILRHLSFFTGSLKVILVRINAYLTTHSRRTIIMRRIFSRVGCVPLVPYDVAHLDLVALALFE